MILIPEIETVVITPPRTASTALHKAVKRRYPDAIALYRHMEANGIPYGYDVWRKVGVVRHPLERLWSLYKYIQKDNTSYKQRMIKLDNEFKIPSFNEWILTEDIPFVTGFDFRDKKFSVFVPYYSCTSPLPETMKSQWYYLRPDLGTIIFNFDNLRELEEELDIILPNENGTDKSDIPETTPEVKRHMHTFFSWDMMQFPHIQTP